LSGDVVVTSPTCVPAPFASRTVSTTPGRGETDPSARRSRKILDFVAWIAAASTEAPTCSA
jgi:hypothetical protein